MGDDARSANLQAKMAERDAAKADKARKYASSY
jgi:hypothetical protein